MLSTSSTSQSTYKKGVAGSRNLWGSYTRDFKDAREFVHKLNLKNNIEWRAYCKSGNKPQDIPATPDKKYKNKGWVNWGDWLGTKSKTTRHDQYKSFTDARDFVHSLGLKSYKEWRVYCKSGNKPPDIPSKPDQKYKNGGWLNFSDWLGLSNRFLSFKDAREFARSLKLTTIKGWREYCNSGKKPKDIPSNPDKTYKNLGWINFGDWLGTQRVANKNREFWPYYKARQFVHSLGFKGVAEWDRYRRSGKRPDYIPSTPRRTYKNKGWVNWAEWLGTNTVAPQLRQYRPFKEAREYANSLGLQSQSEWFQYARTQGLPPDIPIAPHQVYGNEWIDWGSWLGTERKATQDMGWNVEKVKGLLRSLIESRVIFSWTEARLYHFLLTKGVLNLQSSNRHRQFFRNLIEASQTKEGLESIKQYAYSDLKDIPDLLNHFPSSNGEEILSASSEELAKLVNDSGDPLDYGKIPSVEEVFAGTSILESITVDDENMQFFLREAVNDLWKRAFKDGGETTFGDVIKEGKNGRLFHDTVAETFLSEYKSTKEIEIPDGYAFHDKPRLMQKYVAYKVKSNPFFGNFSGTGAGKTLSALLASRIIESKLTVIICPNDVVEQWEQEVYRIFPQSSGSGVRCGRQAFYTLRDESKYQYVILNYDKFNQPDSANLILKLGKQKIDFVVLDEIHYAKRRSDSDDEVSKRRRHLIGLLTESRKRNKDVKVLGLSATPVVNNLTEGISLLEMITGTKYNDIADNPTVPNAVTLYGKLSRISIREIPDYKIKKREEFIEVDAEMPLTGEDVKTLIKNPLSTEKILTEARINEIVNNIDKEGSTIIYTEYVGEGITQKLLRAVTEAGYDAALHTGFDHSGKKLFLAKKAQVLIASSPLSIGIDGLQDVCNTLIINSLPWTNARYQQLIGRLIRIGQKRDYVRVIIIRASLKFRGNEYAYDQRRWNRIEYKRTLADCAVDGILPEKGLITPEQANREAIKWLERLERGEISTVTRRELEVELSPVEVEKRLTQIGDFARLNNRINNEKSETTFERLKRKPEEWVEYHRQLREHRKTWHLIPVEEIIKRIKELSPRLQIGDFGCGEAQIVQTFGRDRVHSFDFVAIDDSITVCDMKSVPLKEGELDVAVFSQSLMNKNWSDHITEAKRCLAKNGYLFIAETSKSLTTRLSKLRGILEEQGFEIYSDYERGDFTFIEARKK